MSAHTPTPWKFDDSDGSIRSPWTSVRPEASELMGDYRGAIIADLSPSASEHGVWPSTARTFAMPEVRANAAFIVRAVNCHDELIAALRKAQRLIEKATPYIRDHACMTADDMRGLGGDAGDAYWIEIAEKWSPEISAAIAKAEGRTT